MSRISKKNGDLLIDMIPPRIYLEYFNILVKKKPLYLPIVIEDNNPILFIEQGKTDSIAGILRVFYKIEDMELYIQFVTKLMGYPRGMIKPYEVDFNRASKMICDLSYENMKANEKPIRAVSVVKWNGSFRDLTIFWSHEPECMV
jgi:hypothetical protein